VKVGRNDPCPCGSGLKYKKCCLGKDTQVNREPGAQYAQRYKIRLKEEADIEGIRKAGQLVLDTFRSRIRYARGSRLMKSTPSCMNLP
jgi:methionyl aminopeptidase